MDLSKYTKYDKLSKELLPVIKLQHRIQLFETSWFNLSEALNKMAKAIYDNNKPLADLRITQQIELLLRNCLATIGETRDIIEKNFYQVISAPYCNNELCKKQSRKVEPKLIHKYTDFEIEHQNLKKFIHNEQQTEKWSRQLRNKLLHGGNLFLDNITSQKNNNNLSTHQVFLMTDFRSINEDKRFKGLNINKYYTDTTIFTMTNVANGHTQWAGYDQSVLKEKRDDILMRANSLDIELKYPDPLENLYLLNNEEFVILPYKLHIEKNLQLAFRFGFFDLSKLLNEIYNGFKMYYSGLYYLICKAENINLKQIMDISDQIMQDTNDTIIFIRPNFALKMVETSYFKNEH